MKGLLVCTVGMAVAASTFGAVIDISTGTGNAAWQVFINGGFQAATSLTTGQQNGTWAPPPTGTSWVSYASQEGTSCTVGQTPGNGCANALINPSGDVWEYMLNISAASLGATSGTLNFIFGSDNRVNLFYGSEPGETWNGGSNTNGVGYDPLGCSGVPPTSAGDTQITYAGCTTTVPFVASDLNGDGSLTIVAFNFNDPIAGCPSCGDPTGFILDGDILTGASASPEPATFGLVALAGLAGLAIRRKQRS